MALLADTIAKKRAVYPGEKQLHEVPEGTKRILQTSEVTARQPGPQRMANDLQVLKSILTGLSMSKTVLMESQKKTGVRSFLV